MTYYKFYMDASNIADKIRSGEYKQVQQQRAEDTQNALIRRPQKQTMQEEPAPRSFADITAEYLNLVSLEDGADYFSQFTPEQLAQVDMYGEGTTTKSDGFRSPTHTYSNYSGLVGLIDQTEGGGSYDTLLNFSNNKEFAGVDITKMTIGQLKAFADGEYGKYSKDRLGYKATPMGRYQIVGTTLADTANKLGLSDDTVFSPEIQDHMFAYLANQAIKSGGISGLRSTWEGFKTVPDDVLQVAADEFMSSSSLLPKRKPARKGK